MSELDTLVRFGAKHLRLEAGRKLVLEDFQRTTLSDYVGGTTETVCLLGSR